MSKKSIRWLLGELPVMVDRGLITAESATRIRLHYTELEGSRSRGMLILSLLGATLIGLGIILLLAHNWQNLTRPLRAVIATLPLITAQLSCLWVIQGHRSNYKEAAATFLTLSLGAAMALITQTYNVPGNPESILLSWMLLSLPVVYLLRATLPAIIYLIGILSWAAYSLQLGHQAIWFWPLSALILPHFIDIRNSNRGLLLGWTIAISGSLALPLTPDIDDLWLLLFSGYFSLLYLSGIIPLKYAGALGAVIMGLLLTIRDVWREAAMIWLPKDDFAAWLLTAVILIGCSALLVRAVWRKQPFLTGCLPFLSIICLLLHNSQIIIFNLWLLSLGGLTIRRGLRLNSIATINGGMLILAGLITLRFFDSSLSFVGRGISFILIGTAFMLVNIYLGRRRAS